MKNATLEEWNELNPRLEERKWRNNSHFSIIFIQTWAPNSDAHLNMFKWYSASQ